MSEAPCDFPSAGTASGAAQASPDWVDTELLAGADDDICLWIGRAVTRSELRALVDEQQRQLATAGLAAGGTATLLLPPSLAYVASLLAAWRIGAQVSLLDHRLSPAEVSRALDRLASQVLVDAESSTSQFMAGYATVTSRAQGRPGGRPASTAHALIQLSSGSTGPSKVIARTAADLLGELGRYAKLDDYPRAGERIVLLASIVHVLGLVGGLLGVPFHAELMTADARPLPQLVRMVVAGELTRPWVPGAFTAGYEVPLGSMYGMTELGVIATDLTGQLAPAVAPAPGMRLRVQDGELQVAMAASPYIGLVDETRWVDGWLRTRDAATIDSATGHVTILGRLDSQVSIGGLKVDLTEVEQTLCSLPQVAGCVVSYDGGIEAYLMLRDSCTLAEVEQEIARELASFKRPRRVFVLPELPRTATGKNVRDRAVLRAAADAARTVRQ
jgi:acyl-coenzyme A synthetase/AMP-(fatty) acid ligase